MLIAGDKIRPTKAIGIFRGFDCEFTVIDISDDGTITFGNSDGVGVISWKEYNEYFEKVEVPKWITLLLCTLGGENN